MASGAPPLVLDVRWRLTGPPARADYEAGHIPSAVFADLDRDLAARPGSGGRHPLPLPEDAAGALRALGVREDRDVVVYDAADSTSAARAWWVLRYFGHPSVSLLDGGFAGWCAAGLPVEAGVVPADPSDFEVRPGGMPILDAGAAAEVARQGVLLDARSAVRYRGESEPVDPVAGHIPGAVNAPTTEHVTEEGVFLPAEELSRRFASLGVTPGRPVGAYCGSGVTAAHAIFALFRAGIPAALYVGSWSEWIADRNRPVARGSGPEGVPSRPGD